MLTFLVERRQTSRSFQVALNLHQYFVTNFQLFPTIYIYIYTWHLCNLLCSDKQHNKYFSSIWNFRIRVILILRFMKKKTSHFTRKKMNAKITIQWGILSLKYRFAERIVEIYVKILNGYRYFDVFKDFKRKRTGKMQKKKEWNIYF